MHMVTRVRPKFASYYLLSHLASIAKWSGHQPTNQKVVVSTPGVTTFMLLLFPWPNNFTHIAPSSLPRCINGGLVPTGEAAHPVVTLMGTWCKSWQAKLMSLSYLMVLGLFRTWVLWPLIMSSRLLQLLVTRPALNLIISI